MPLDVLLQAMRQRWQEGCLDEAAALAKAAAPYVHAKPQSGRGPMMMSELGDDELDALCRGGTDGASAAAEDTEQP